MTAVIKVYPKIAQESTDFPYQAVIDLKSADTDALVASTSMYCVPAAGPLTYTAFNLTQSVIAGGLGKPAGWIAVAIGGIRYRVPLLADS